MTSAMTAKGSAADYARRISTALNAALSSQRVIAKVGTRQQDSLLYVALEPLLSEGERTQVDAPPRPDAAVLLPLLQRVLVDVRSQLKLEWVKLTKVSGRLPDQTTPLWQEDLLLDSSKRPGDVSISVGGNLSGQLIIGDNNQAYNYTYNVEHGGVLNVAAPPMVRPRPCPLSVKPRPFHALLDRQTVLPVLRSTLEQVLPVELFAKAGFGKTALMRHLAHDAQLTACFADGVVYLSVHRQAAEDVLQSIYDIFYEANPSFKPSYGQLQQSLKDKQALLILDGLMLNKEEMDPLLDALPSCGVVLVSLERIYWQDGAAIALEGLPLPESITLLQKELGRALTDIEQPAARALWSALAGNPLQLRRAAEQLAIAQPVDTRSASPQAASPQSIAQRCLDNLSEHQRAVLGLLGAMGGVALSADQAQAIAQVPETASVLSELADLHLVDATGSHFQICGDLVDVVQQTISPDPWLQEATNYFVNQGANLAESNCVEVMTHLMDWTQQTQQWQQSIALAKHLDQPLSTSGQWARWQDVLDSCLQAAEQSGDGNAEAWALHQLGTRSLAVGDVAQADGWMVRSLWLREQLGDHAGAAITRHNLGFITPPLVVGSIVPATSPLVESAAQVAQPGRRGWLPLGAAAVGIVLAGTAALTLLADREPAVSDDLSGTQDVSESIIEPIAPVPTAATTAPKLIFDPGQLVFGETLLNQVSRQPVVVTNTGDAPANIDAIELLGQQANSFSLIDQSCGSKTLLPQAKCQFEVVFTPKTAGDYTASLRLNRKGGDAQLLTLTGTGQTAADEIESSVEASSEPLVSEVTQTILEKPEELVALSANDDIDSVDAGASVVIDVLANDVVAEADNVAGPVTIVDVSEPERGVAAVESGDIVYAHGGEGVRDRFTYTIQDADGNMDTAIVAISVAEREPQPLTGTGTETGTKPDPEANPQQPPSVTNYKVEVTIGDPPVDVNLLANATDPNPNDVLRVLKVANDPQLGGELIDNDDGTVTYVPAAQIPTPENENEVVVAYNNSFEFEITDDQGGVAIATLYIRVVIPQETE